MAKTCSRSIHSSVTVIRPNRRFELGYGACLVRVVLTIIRSRELIVQLFKRDYFAVYKKALLGAFWVVITPLIGILSWIFLNHVKVLRPGDVGVPYPVYVLAGTLVWGWFMSMLRGAAYTLDGYRHFILHINIPHEILYIIQILSACVDFMFSCALSAAVLAVARVWPSWYGVLLAPLVALPLFFLASGIGLCVSLISIVSYDFYRLTFGAMGLVMFVTPLVYAPDAVRNPFLSAVIRMNPCTYLVCSVRDMVLYGRLYNMTGYVVAAVGAFLLFLFSLRLFYVAEDKIVERMI